MADPTDADYDIGASIADCVPVQYRNDLANDIAIAIATARAAGADEERERCARACEDVYHERGFGHDREVATLCANRIRSPR